ncbi:protein of unknown function [Streptomyces murinus]
MTYSHPNKRFGHIPSRRSTRRAYCATLAAGSRTDRGLAPVRLASSGAHRMSRRRPKGTAGIARVRSHSHPTQGTGAPIDSGP